MSAHPSASPPGPGLLEQLFRRRLVVVMGKGGAGKTTVSAVLARLAARSGRRVLLVELGGARALARLLGVGSPDYRPLPVGHGAWLLSMDAHAALEDYLLRQLRLRSLYRLAFRNRWVGPFMDAIPGLPDLIQLGKVWDLLQEQEEGRSRWDLVVLDAPATGHGLGLLAAPRSMMELTGSGPFHANARKVHELLADPAQTAVLLCALPEPLPVNEAFELARALADAHFQLTACVLDQLHEPPFSPLEAWPLARPSLAALPGPAWAEALALTDHRVASARRQAESERRLRAGLGVPVLGLPWAPSEARGGRDLGRLADRLAAAAGAPTPEAP